MKRLEEKIRQMLDELGQALAEAIRNSPGVSETIEQIRQDGYALHLMVGNMQLSDEKEGTLGEPPPPETTEPTVETPAPPFRVNTDDVTFLKSIGIDPTRAVRRRRKPRSLA